MCEDLGKQSVTKAKNGRVLKKKGHQMLKRGPGRRGEKDLAIRRSLTTFKKTDVPSDKSRSHEGKVQG